MELTDDELIEKWIKIISNNSSIGQFELKNILRGRGAHLSIPEYNEISQVTKLLVNHNLIEALPFNSARGIEYKISNPYFSSIIKSGGWLNFKKNQEIEQLSDNEDKILMRLVNKSVIDTNNSINIVSEKTLGIYRFQKWSTAITIIVASFAVWVSYKQFKNDESSKTQEQIRQSETKQIQSQIHTLSIKVDSIKLQTLMDLKKKK
jgi:hypothetical protein